MTRLAFARWLMRRPGWMWMGVPTRLQTWACHQHLMTFPSYRHAYESGVGLRRPPKPSFHDRFCPCNETSDLP